MRKSVNLNLKKTLTEDVNYLSTNRKEKEFTPHFPTEMSHGESLQNLMAERLEENILRALGKI